MSFASFHDMGDAVSTIGPNMPFLDKYYSSVWRTNLKGEIKEVD